MYEALKDIAFFVTAVVGFVYGARVAWGCGRRGFFGEKPQDKLQLLMESIPAAALLFAVGFLVVFDYFIDEFFSWIILSLISAFLSSLAVVFVAMPRLRRRSHDGDGVVVELVNGTICRMTKKTFNTYLSRGKISKFKRSDGWVSVNAGRLRESQSDAVYVGVDRRSED